MSKNYIGQPCYVFFVDRYGTLAEPFRLGRRTIRVLLSTGEYIRVPIYWVDTHGIRGFLHVRE